MDEIERKRKAEKDRLAFIREENAKQRGIRAQMQRCVQHHAMRLIGKGRTSGDRMRQLFRKSGRGEGGSVFVGL